MIKPLLIRAFGQRKPSTEFVTLRKAGFGAHSSFKFSASFAKKTDYVVEITKNFKVWDILEAGEAKGEFEFVDSKAGKMKQCFYRLCGEGANSHNIIGFTSVTVPSGFAMIANPLRSPDPRVSTLLAGMPDGTKLSKFNANLHQLNENVLQCGDWRYPDEILTPGEGAIVFNPAPTERTLYFVGEVIQESYSVPIPAGFSIRSCPAPLSGELDGELGFPTEEADVVHRFDTGKQEYVIHTFEKGEWSCGTPVMGPGEAFWVAKTKEREWDNKGLLALCSSNPMAATVLA